MKIRSPNQVLREKRFGLKDFLQISINSFSSLSLCIYFYRFLFLSIFESFTIILSYYSLFLTQSIILSVSQSITLFISICHSNILSIFNLTLILFISLYLTLLLFISLYLTLLLFISLYLTLILPYLDISLYYSFISIFHSITLFYLSLHYSFLSFTPLLFFYLSLYYTFLSLSFTLLLFSFSISHSIYLFYHFLGVCLDPVVSKDFLHLSVEFKEKDFQTFPELLISKSSHKTDGTLTWPKLLSVAPFKEWPKLEVADSVTRLSEIWPMWQKF